MSIFANLFKKGNEGLYNQELTQTAQVGNTTMPNGGLLDLSKGDILDLTKYNLSNVRAAAGWDVHKGFGADYDLDLCAYCFAGDTLLRTVYYGRRTWTGIYLDGDNLTGSGEGDDENIFVNLNQIPFNITKIIFAVVIFEANNRKQQFKNVKNAYMRLIDELTNNEICRYRLTEDGTTNTAATLASLEKMNGVWQFHAIGEYSTDTISSLGNKL